jgi:hypothetical protein
MMLIPTEDPRTWPLKVPIIAHDVGRSNDRSTAVIGGNSPFTLGARLLGVKEFVELPLGLYGSDLANELARIDQTYNRDSLIVADLSNDPTYGETLADTFGPRVVGVQIGRSGDGTTYERRRAGKGVIPVYNVGRTFLFELLAAEFRNHRVCFPNCSESTRAYAQLNALEVEQRDTGRIYKCPPGQHDDLAMSVAMLAWAAQHAHLDYWMRPIFDAHRPRRQRQQAGWKSFV